ncbi:MAG: heavy-metal-associated domain-containing protein [Lentisphaeraceae bacterium]|nr:heavy-metal-associated domain-containing protein [Lentisphaeraceae bacterium]
MTRIITLLIVSYALMGCNEVKESELPLILTSSDKIIIEVDEMGCRSCVRKIKKHLYQHPGIKTLKANTQNGTITIELFSKNSYRAADFSGKVREAIFCSTKGHLCKVCISKKSL